MKNAQLYEAVGMNNEQARQVAELLAGGAVLWRLGHSWINENCVVRPQACRCHHCSPVEALNSIHKALEDAADMLHECAQECSDCNYGDGATGKGSDGSICEECAPIREAERRAREALPSAKQVETTAHNVPYHQMPQHIINKAVEVRRWFDERGLTRWSIAGIGPLHAEEPPERPYAVGPTNRNPWPPGTPLSHAYETRYRHGSEDARGAAKATGTP